jgi:H+-translocating diphosphatase
MRTVSDPIREGAEGFLKIQYSAILRMAVLMALVIMGSYSLRPTGSVEGGVDQLGPVMLGILSSVSFALGAACSAFTGM